MKAEILMIGTELLLGQIEDTNATYISRVLAENGISLYQKTTVGDNTERICEALERALERSDVVLCSGGLGPTEDDITRECVLSFAEAAKQLPLRRGGRRVHVATLYRWASAGLRGVRLETLRVGGTLCTSLKALQRFFDALSDRSSLFDRDAVEARTGAGGGERA